MPTHGATPPPPSYAAPQEYDGAKCAALGVRDDARLTAIAGLRQRHAARCDAVDDLAERQEHSALLRYQRPQAAWDSVVHGHDILNGKPLGLTAGELKVWVPLHSPIPPFFQNIPLFKVCIQGILTGFWLQTPPPKGGVGQK